LVDEELHDLYSKPDSVLSRKSGSVFGVLLETPDGERPLGRHISVCVCLHLQNASSSLNILRNEQESDSWWKTVLCILPLYSRGTRFTFQPRDQLSSLQPLVGSHIP
jgi:hypothetical protein